MGERGKVVRYAYWSERRIRSIAADNDIDLERRLGWTAKWPAALLTLLPVLPELEIRAERRDVRRREIADRIESAIGDLAVEDFVTPPSVPFAKGVSRIHFAHFVGLRDKTDPVVVHTTVSSSTGELVEVCLFGSMDNVAGYIGGTDQTGSGWVSSAAHAVGIYLQSRCMINNSQWDDPESIAIEALQICEAPGLYRH